MAIELATQIGGGDETQTSGRPTSPPYDPDLPGFAGNYTFQDPGAEVYPRRFLVMTPEVEAAVRDPVSAEQTAIYDIEIPNDLFEVST